MEIATELFFSLSLHAKTPISSSQNYVEIIHNRNQSQHCIYKELTATYLDSES